MTEEAKSPLVSYDVQLNLALANDMFFISIGEVQTSVARLLEMMTVLAHHDAAPYFDRYPPAFIAASGSIMQRGVILLELRAALCNPLSQKQGQLAPALAHIVSS